MTSAQRIFHGTQAEVDDTGYGNIKKLVGNPVGELLLDDDGRSPNASKYAYPSVGSI